MGKPCKGGCFRALTRQQVASDGRRGRISYPKYRRFLTRRSALERAFKEIPSASPDVLLETDRAPRPRPRSRLRPTTARTLAGQAKTRARIPHHACGPLRRISARCAGGGKAPREFVSVAARSQSSSSTMKPLRTDARCNGIEDLLMPRANGDLRLANSVESSSPAVTGGRMAVAKPNRVSSRSASAALGHRDLTRI